MFCAMRRHIVICFCLLFPNYAIYVFNIIFMFFFCFLFFIFFVFVLFCVLFLLVYLAVSVPIFVQVYRPLPTA